MIDDIAIEDNVIEPILDVLEGEVVPLTRAGVAAGNKIFGGAVLDRHSLETVVVGTNGETENPLFHGEIATLNRFWALPSADRPAPADCLFVSTHEPCSLCLSAITWSGFDNFFYLFSYESSRDDFAIPHDLRILAEVFKLPDGDYARTNAFWTAYSLTELVAELPPDRRSAAETRLDRLTDAYRELSDAYQASKADSDIPLN